VRLVAGNTGYGIYKEWLPEDHLIDVKQVPELRRLSLSKVRPVKHGPISVLSNREACLIQTRTSQQVLLCLAGLV